MALWNPSYGFLPHEYVFHDDSMGDRPTLRVRNRGDTPMSILRVNKQIREEAESIFCANNCFAVQNDLAELSDLFLPQIGKQNTSIITKLCFPFPLFNITQFANSRSMELAPASVQGLEGLCANFPSLVQIEFRFGMTKSLDMIERNMGYEAAVEAIEKVRSYFKQLSSLEKVYIALSEDFYLEDSKRMRLRNKVKYFGVMPWWTR